MPVKKDLQGRNTSDKFDIGRNFCNKIWNVANFFVIPNLTHIEPEPVNEGQWSLADRWIVSRFSRAVADADAAIAAYRFDQYANICYDFFWNDFCGWYVEICKPALKVPATAGPTANILAAVLDGALRLMHPMIPFITENIWWRLNEARPQRGLPVSLECPGSQRLIRAQWPAASSQADPAEAIFGRIKDIVTVIRKLRNDYKVDLKRRLDVSILALGNALHQVESNQGIIESMANCRIVMVSDAMPPVPGVAHASAAGCDVFIDDLQDQTTLVQQNTRREAELARLIQTLEGRLANESYAAKAPAALVLQTREQLVEANRELAKLRNTAF